MDQLKTSPSIADVEFIHAIKSGGLSADKAIMSLYALYHKDIRSCMTSLMSRYKRSKEKLDDIVHDSFMILLYKIEHESPVIVSVRAYWLGIARHIWLNLIKRVNRIDLVEDDEELYGYHEESPENIFLGNEKYEQLHKCMASCSKRCHEILLLWLADYTMQEIADRMNLSSPAMARKIKHKCFKKIKNLVINCHIFTP